MAKSMVSNNRKKKRIGRPPVGAIPVLVRIPPREMLPIDDWIAGQKGFTSRPEAIRRLVEIGLSAQKLARPKASSGAARAAELAASVIEKHIDFSAPAEERESRKRRLLKGPGAFRDVRVDRTKKEMSAPACESGLKATKK
jgi:hypothetical protein